MILKSEVLGQFLQKKIHFWFYSPTNQNEDNAITKGSQVPEQHHETNNDRNSAFNTNACTISVLLHVEIKALYSRQL